MLLQWQTNFKTSLEGTNIPTIMHKVKLKFSLGPEPADLSKFTSLTLLVLRSMDLDCNIIGCPEILEHNCHKNMSSMIYISPHCCFSFSSELWLRQWVMGYVFDTNFILSIPNSIPMIMLEPLIGFLVVGSPGLKLFMKLKAITKSKLTPHLLNSWLNVRLHMSVLTKVEIKTVNNEVLILISCCQMNWIAAFKWSVTTAHNAAWFSPQKTFFKWQMRPRYDRQKPMYAFCKFMVL